MEVMFKEMVELGELKEGERGSGKGKGGTVWLKMDGCAKQYKCGKAMYLLCQLALRLDLTLDQMNEGSPATVRTRRTVTAASSRTG
jgi:hypothetical protein